MSQYLNQYELTEEGKKQEEIALTANDLGDATFIHKTDRLTDRLAAILYNRKDGRGKKYVRLKQAARAGGKKG
ncbi:MAG: hypothetical protein AAFW00_25035 [Bacteroidota bacterium]